MRHAYGIVRDPGGGATHLAARVGDEAVDLRAVRGVPEHVAEAGLRAGELAEVTGTTAPPQEAH